MTAPNYGEIAERLEANNSRPFLDAPHILALLGYETMTTHGRLGVACRKDGDRHWQSIPHFRSADDFEMWVLNNGIGTLNDISQSEDGTFSISFETSEHGNDYGTSRTMGSAMWAAFVRVVGRVGSGEDD